MTSHDDHTRLRNVSSVAALTVATALLAGCYAAPPRARIVATTYVEGPNTEAIVTVRPPVPRPEMIPVAPSARVVWDPGRWRWDGRTYVWVAGHYVERPREAAIWVPGHWADRNGGWVWVEGHWRA